MIDGLRATSLLEFHADPPDQVEEAHHVMGMLPPVQPGREFVHSPGLQEIDEQIHPKALDFVSGQFTARGGFLSLDGRAPGVAVARPVRHASSIPDKQVQEG